MTDVLIRRGETQRQMCTEGGASCEDAGRTLVMMQVGASHLQVRDPKDAGSTDTKRKAGCRPSMRAFKRAWPCRLLRFWTSGFQNCERISVCCFSTLCFVQAALEMDTGMVVGFVPLKWDNFDAMCVSSDLGVLWPGMQEQTCHAPQDLS